MYIFNKYIFKVPGDDAATLYRRIILLLTSHYFFLDGSNHFAIFNYF